LLFDLVTHSANNQNNAPRYAVLSTAYQRQQRCAVSRIHKLLTTTVSPNTLAQRLPPHAVIANEVALTQGILAHSYSCVVVRYKGLAKQLGLDCIGVLTKYAFYYENISPLPQPKRNALGISWPLASSAIMTHHHDL
jgi:hypothetical protein